MIPISNFQLPILTHKKKIANAFKTNVIARACAFARNRCRLRARAHADASNRNSNTCSSNTRANAGSTNGDSSASCGINPGHDSDYRYAGALAFRDFRNGVVRR